MKRIYFALLSVLFLGMLFVGLIKFDKFKVFAQEPGDEISGTKEASGGNQSEVIVNTSGGITLKGVVYNTQTGLGIPNVEVLNCNLGNKTAITDDKGEFSYKKVKKEQEFCLRVNPIPGFDGPERNYECQTAGKEVSQSCDPNGDMKEDNKYKFAFTPNGSSQLPIPSQTPAGSQIPSSTPAVSQLPDTSPLGTTVEYRIAETETGLDSAEFKPYETEPVITNIILTDAKPGIKQIWVEFKSSDGRTKKEHINIDFLERTPEISHVSCTLDISRQNLKVEVFGSSFGANRGKLSSGSTQLEILEWKKNNVAGVLRRPSISTDDTATFNIKLSKADGTELPEVPCKIDTSLISLGARIFCRDEGKFDVANVKVTLKDQNDSKVNETVTIDKNGTIPNLKSKFQLNKRYLVSIEAPFSLRKNAMFTAGSGTTLVVNEDGSPFILPVGDIAPVNGPDGVINAADRAVLTRQWIASKTASKNLTADFNRDQRVNSFDWACMRYDFGKSDDPLADQVSLTCAKPPACDGKLVVGEPDPSDNLKCPVYTCDEDDLGSFPEVPSSSSENTACAQDSQQCSDGTFVSRVPPTCQFAACPTNSTPLPQQSSIPSPQSSIPSPQSSPAQPISFVSQPALGTSKGIGKGIENIIFTTNVCPQSFSIANDYEGKDKPKSPLVITQFNCTQGHINQNIKGFVVDDKKGSCNELTVTVTGSDGSKATSNILKWCSNNDG